MTTSDANDSAAILVEFASASGVRAVALDPKSMEEKSAKAVTAAMNTVRNMAGKVTDTIDGLAKRPSEVEVSFGITLNAEAGALIAKTGMEASLQVTLTWAAKGGGET